MNARTAVLRVAALALIALAGFASAAHAEDVLLEPAGNITSTGRLTLTAGTAVVCTVTLSGSFSRSTLNMSAGTTFGSASRLSWSGCTGGELRATLGTPWTIALTSVPGEYPETYSNLRLEIRNLQIQATVSGVTCLYSGDQGLEVGLTPDAERDYAWDTGSARVLAETLSLISGSCARTATFAGSLTLTAQEVQRRMARIRMIGADIPSEQDLVELSLRNISPERHPSGGITDDTLINDGGGDNPGAFEIPTDACRGNSLMPGGATQCVIRVRFKNMDPRPRNTSIRVTWTNGVAGAPAEVSRRRIIAQAP